MKKRNRRSKWPKQATVTRATTGEKYVTAVDGYVAILVNGSINGTLAPVGTKGKLVWSSGPSYSLPFFVWKEQRA